MWRRHGLQALDRISAYAPELGTEIEGIAAGSGLPVEAIGALNARTELLAAAAGECSTIACLGSMTASGSALGIQTWDWHNELAEGWIVWTIEHPDGRRVETHDRGRHRRQDRDERPRRRRPAQHPRPP